MTAYPISEAQFQAQIIQLARLNQWLVFHPKKMQGYDGSWRTALSGDKGWPDLVLAHRERGFIVAELKTSAGKLSQEQHKWLYHLQPHAEIYVWRPQDIIDIGKRLATTKDRYLESIAG